MKKIDFKRWTAGFLLFNFLMAIAVPVFSSLSVSVSNPEFKISASGSEKPPVSGDQVPFEKEEKNSGLEENLKESKEGKGNCRELYHEGIFQFANGKIFFHLGFKTYSEQNSDNLFDHHLFLANHSLLI